MAKKSFVTFAQNVVQEHRAVRAHHLAADDLDWDQAAREQAIMKARVPRRLRAEPRAPAIRIPS